MIHAAVITGWHSGPNPSPGLGVALSIKQVYPDVRILALDYSNRSTGLYHDVVDQRIIFPKWSDMDREQYQEDVLALLREEAAVLFSCLDLEMDVLADLGQRKDGWRLVIPPKLAICAASKPCVEMAEVLGLPVLDTSSTSIRGEEHSIAFAAYKGELLGCIGMNKTELTELRKTWCGNLCPVSPGEQKRVARFVKEFNWTGGGGLEMIHADADGRDYLTDVNLRFPAWIYGASVNGYNLPAALFAKAVGVRALKLTPVNRSFVRVVTEVVSPTLMELDKVTSRRRDFGKGHPSGMAELAGGMGPVDEDPEALGNGACVLASDKGAWLDKMVHDVDDRPRRIIDNTRLVGNIKSIKNLNSQPVCG